MRSIVCLLLALSSAFPVAAQRTKKAKNIILFLADAGGVSTVNAASIHGYNEAQKLFIQSWPNVALSDTSTASQWVSDSAAGMTAIVTGVKTHNGVISQGPDTERGKKDGTPLKTILEYAEERGLSTGVLSTQSIADATPAACYAHANQRSDWGNIFMQLFSPRFGDGPDVVIGAGRKQIFELAAKLGKNPVAAGQAAGRPVRSNLEEAASDARPIVVSDSAVDLPAATRRALGVLSKNKKGYFLMIEWDAHTDNPRKGLDNVVNFDKLIREIAGMVNREETLLLFTADHSFELRTTGGRRGDDLLKGLDEWQKTHESREMIQIPAMRVGHSHTGEEVPVMATGPGAELVRGYLPNTRLFQVMLAAWGWKAGK